MHKKLGFRWNILACSLAIGFASMQSVRAFDGIATDGTVGPVQVLNAPGVSSNVTIQQGLGTTVGNNLFHSFSTFNIETGQTVTFKENVTNSLNNVISRVTGGGVSNLDGMLRSTPGGHADFYLINPSGVVFGANAQLDVAGAFHVSTADQLNFRDGSSYSAVNPNASNLSSSSPSSFGFLGTSTANNGLIDVNGAQLSAKPSQTIEIVAGNINMENQAKLEAPGGEIRLVAVGSGETNVLPNIPSESAFGTIDIESSSIDVSGDGAGKLIVQGGDVTISGSDFLASNKGITDGNITQGIDIMANNLLTVNNGSHISSDTYSTENAGSIQLKGKQITLDNISINSAAQAGSTGNGGDITVSANDSLSISNSTNIDSATYSSGNAGSIQLTGKSIKLDNSFVSNIAQEKSTGNAGDTEINAGEYLSVNNESDISTLAYSSGNSGSIKLTGKSINFNNSYISDSLVLDSTGNAGNITLNADDTLTFSGGEILDITVGKGNSGDVNIKANNELNLINNIFILTNSLDTGNGGSIYLSGNKINLSSIYFESVAETSISSGNAGNISITAYDTLNISDASYIASETRSIGKAGNISLSTNNSFNISNGSQILSSTYDSSDAGNISIKANSIVIDGASIFAGVYYGGTGNGGLVSVKTIGDLKVFNGGEISSSTSGSGSAGDVNVKAGNIIMDGQVSHYAAILSDSNSGATGNAGVVKVESTGTISLSNGAQISSSTYGSGDGGNVNVKSDSLIINGYGEKSFLDNTFTGILATAYPDSIGKAGTISVETIGDLKISNAGFISSSTFGSGSAGDVSVKAGNIDINGKASQFPPGICSDCFLDPANGTAGIVSDSLKGTGNAGLIHVESSSAINLLNGAVISSTSFFSPGNAGDVSVKAKSLVIDGFGVEIPTGVFALADDGSTGKAGKVSVEIADSLKIFNDGEISSSTFGPGSAGDVNVKAGDITIDGRDIQYAGISSESNSGATGNAGSVHVESTGLINLLNGGFISSSSSSQGDAGNVSVKANSLAIDGFGVQSFQPPDFIRTGIFAAAELGSTGKAGMVSVETLGDLKILNAGFISSSTVSSGSAGDVNVKAGSIEIDGKGSQYGTGIFSDASAGSTGQAGSVEVEANTLVSLSNAGRISTNTNGSGGAGSVKVVARQIDIDNSSIAARADVGSGGQTGNVTVNATDSLNLAYGGQISIQNNGFSQNSTTVIPGQLTVSAPAISLDNGLISAATSGNVGAGSVAVSASQTLFEANGSSINSSTSGIGDAGSVTVNAPSISLDNSTITAETSGLGGAGSVGVSSSALTMGHNASIAAKANLGSGGQTGDVTVNAADSLNIANGANISIQNDGSAQNPATVIPGQLTVSAPTIALDHGSITAETTGNVRGGSVAVTAGRFLTATNGASINASTFGVGRAGDVAVAAPTFFLASGADISAQAAKGSSGQTGQVRVTTNVATLSSGGKISVQNDGFADDPSQVTPASLSINVPYLTMDGGIITAATSGNVPAGDVSVKTLNPLFMSVNASISSSTQGSGRAGSVNVDAPAINLDNSAITAETSGLGAAGSVSVSSATLSIGNNASITAKANLGSGGQTGDVTINASSSLNIANGGNISIQNDGSTQNPTGIIPGTLTLQTPWLTLDNGFVSAATSGNVNAGVVTVNAAQTLSEANGSSINSSTSGLGNAGSVKVDAPSIRLDNSAITAETEGLGAAGSVNVSSTTLALINNASIAAKADANSGGQTGDVVVNASGSINIVSGGNISIENQGTAANPASVIPGQLIVTAPVTALDNGFISASTSGNVNAGTVTVDAAQTLSEANGSSINSSTSGSGNAGSAKVSAPAISLDNSAIAAKTSGLGEAGNVSVSSATLSIINNASIAAEADANSGGQTGDVTVNASGSITMDNSNISIQNLGFALDPKAVTPGLLYVSAPDITLRDSIINSHSTQNVDASPIQIHFTHSLSLGNSFISTEAQNGNGGSIVVQGGDSLTLTNSGIRTSVLGQNGNGGDISVTANRLMMETGLIQANTAASGANGGNVFLNVQTLLPSASMLIFGGNEPVNWDIHSTEFGWNVIQAAAPGGISGVINLTSPQLNLNGVLSNLGNPKFYSDTLNQDVCSMGTGSSLVRRGKGGMPAKSSDLLLFY